MASDQVQIGSPLQLLQTDAFQGNELRPYTPCHLVAKITDQAAWASWVGRSRIDDDSWQRAEVRLGEEAKLYIVRLVSNRQIMHQDTVLQPLWSS